MAAVKSNIGEAPTVPEAHSQVFTETSHPHITDLGDLAKAKRLARSGNWKANMRHAGTSKGLLNPALAIGLTVNGSIEAKMDSSYLINAVIQGEELKGVLYHVHPKSKVKQFTKVMAPPVELQATNLKLFKSNGTLKRRYRRNKFPTKDRNAPKKNRTGYNFFFAKERLRLKEYFPEMRAEREISQAIAEAWNSLSVEQKEPYQQLGVKDKERYRKEMHEYVYERVYNMKPPAEGNKADGGGVPLREDGLSSQAQDTLSLKKPEGDGGVRIEENGSNPLSVDLFQSDTAAPVTPFL